MMRQVEGFLTYDGVFYERKEDAEYHEAVKDLRHSAKNSPSGLSLIGSNHETGINNLTTFLKTHTTVVMTFCNAFMVLEKKDAMSELDEMTKGTSYEPDQEPDEIEGEDEAPSRGRRSGRNATSNPDTEMSDEDLDGD